MGRYVLAVALVTTPLLADCPTGLLGARSYPAHFSDVVLADVDGDGFVDAAGSSGTAVGVLLNLGDGTLGPELQSPLLGYGRFVVAADLDGDGTQDLAVTGYQTATLFVLAGNGDGTFDAARTYTQPVEARDVEASDLDGDGWLDLATAHGDGAVRVMLGGSGGFQPPVSWSAGSSPQSLSIGDLDADGDEDIVAADDAGALIVLLNRGDASFLPSRSHPLGSPASSTSVARIDSDVHMDVVVGTRDGFSVLLGTGGGDLGAPRDFATIDGYLKDLVATDLDGDGDQDVLLRSIFSLEVWAGSASGTFQQSAVHPRPAFDVGHLAIADLDRDGCVDVVDDSPAVVAYTNEGGELQATRFDCSIDSVAWPHGATVADFDGDGFADVAAVDAQSPLRILLNDGTGTFVRSATYPQHGGGILRSGDWNLDGRIDLALGGLIPPSYATVFLGNGDGTFQELPGAGFNVGDAMTTLDADGDGATDVVGTTAGRLYPYLSNGDGTFRGAGQWLTGVLIKEWAAIDANGDGVDDLALAHDQGILLMLGDVDGSFRPGADYRIGEQDSVHAVDLDADGATDLVAAGGGIVTTLLATGTGTFVPIPGITLPWSTDGSFMSSGDLDGDGYLDIAMATESSVAILIGDGNGRLAYVAAYDASWGPTFTLDVDGDGLLDVLQPPCLALLLGKVALTIIPPTLPAGTEGSPYSVSLDVVNGTLPATFAIASGSLPPGLSLFSAGLVAGVPTAVGTFDVTVVVTDAAACTASRSYRISIAGGFAARRLIAGAGFGPPNPNRVKALEQDGSTTGTDFLAYAAGAWGVDVAAGSLDGATGGIVSGPGPGAVLGPHVRGWERGGVPLPGLGFFAYGTLRYGVAPGSGDVDGDGRDDLLTGSGPGVVFGPHVRGFAWDGARVSAIPAIGYFAYGTLAYGVGVAAGDVEADGFDEIVTAPGPGPVFGSQVRGWNVDGAPATAIGRINFYAFALPGHGAHAAAGDADGDVFAEMAVAPGPGPGHPPRFVGFEDDGAGVRALPGYDVTTSTATTYGGRAGLSDITGDARGDLLTAPGRDPAAPSVVRPFVYLGGQLTPLASFEVFAGLGYGANVTGGDLGP